VPGSAGTDTALPPTDSQQSVQGRGPFSGLKVTVNQTRHLANQAVSLTWSGGLATHRISRTFGENFLQVFQCWGDPDGTVPDNPGPPPEQCQQGATDGVFGGRSSTLFEGFTQYRIISRRGAPDYDPTQGSLDEKTGNLSKPFRAVDGTVVDQQIDTSFNPHAGGGSFWLNPYFNVITTNEIAGAKTSPDGTGAELFEATTGLESTGLGCGQKVQKRPDGSMTVPRCWLVVVPRGRAVDENQGTGLPDNVAVATSPLGPKAWKNRISIPLEFNPVDSSCPLSAEQRRIVGSELLAAAVSSWQPTLCAMANLSPYAYGSISDSRGRQQLLSGVPGAPGMAVMSKPYDPAALDPQNPVTYAPLTLSGTVIGFNLERVPTEPLGANGEPTPEGNLAGVRVAELNLTPRLVAKLLTQSYRTQVEINGSLPDYPWSTGNPTQLAADPDFVQFNPEFELLRIAGGKNMGGLVLPGPNSDAAQQLWEWVLADPEARTWLAGTPDTFGMKVNPRYSTSPSINPQGSFGDPLPDSYPKNDPYCYQGEKVGVTASVPPPPLCGLDWLPYSLSLREAARAARAANDNARTTVDAFAPSPDKVYTADGPQVLGSRAILSITDTASAAKFGVQMARLSRAGDNTAGRSFIAPDHAGLTAGVKAMAPKAVAGFLEPKPAAAPSGAYPLTALTYAAVAPLSLDPTARREYAAFVDYAAGPGQTPGFEFGQLPPGYEPLPDELRAQARTAAAALRDLKAAVTALPPATGQQESGPGDGAPVTGAGSGSLTGTGDITAASSLGPGGSMPRPAAKPAATKSAARKLIDTISSALRTPFAHLGATRFALPLLVVVACLAGLVALEITRRPQRAAARRPLVPPALEALGPDDPGGAAPDAT